jgi:FkbM family methyltransferase
MIMAEFKTVNFNDRWPIKLLKSLSVMQVNQFKFWERSRMDHMYTAIRPDDIVLDIGACNGEMSAVFASWLGPEGKMILVEPSPDFWPIIRGHWEANNLPMPYMTFCGLVSNETDESRAKAHIQHSAWPKEAEGEIKLEVGFSHLNEKPILPVLKIDDLGLDGVDIITIDCEGSEYEILQGAEGTISKFHPIIFASVHPEMLWREHHHSPDDLHVMLGKWGYENNYLEFDHEQHILYKYRGEEGFRND